MLLTALVASVSPVAILVGLFPVMGAGSYIFAVDYCMYNLEGLFYQIVMPFFYLPSLALVAFFVVNGYKKVLPSLSSAQQLSDLRWGFRCETWASLQLGDGPVLFHTRLPQTVQDPPYFKE